MQLPSLKKDFTPKYQVPLVEQITEFLINAIIEGRLQMRQRLGENELQRKFGISRAPIRESFRILEKKGLLNIIPRKGTFVREITKKDVEENFTILAYLEGLAAREAIFHLTSEKIEEMESAFSEMADAASRGDLDTYLRYHAIFHEIFVKASKNDALIEILENLRRLTTWFRFSKLRIQEQFEYTIPIHRKILDLFIKKDPDGLEALVKEHLLVALERSLQFLTSKRKTGRHTPVRVRRRSQARVKH